MTSIPPVQPALNFRRATPADWPGMLALQEANLFENLDAEARR